MIVGGILAGGTGSRMSCANMPKQFLPLGDEPIILITLRQLLSIRQLDIIYIVIHPQWAEYMQEILNNSDIKSDIPVRLVDGGSTRLESIENLIGRVVHDWEISDRDDILIHDSVRPFVSRKILLDSIEKLKSSKAVGVACPVNDTMFRILEGDVISDMPRRDVLYHGQTPDSFKILALKKAMEQLTAEERSTITGTAQICMIKGIPIHTVPGSSDNIKITTDGDYRLASLMYELEKKEEQRNECIGD